LKHLPMRPQGWAGRAFGLLMERLNRPAYDAAVRLLAPQAGERFLEIGFGTGRLVELLLAAAPDVRVAGVDPTATMVDVASARTGVLVAGSRVELRQGPDSPLPWERGRFDGVAALHSFQFWPDPVASIHEISRVLRPGGRLLFVLRDHSRNPPDWLPNPLSRSGAESEMVATLLKDVGYEVKSPPPVGSSTVILATRDREPRA